MTDVDPGEAARSLPVAQVRVDSGLPQLDRIFDYAVPPALDAVARPGVRVRVRLAGRLVNGFIVGRAAEPSVAMRLRPIERVISPEVVLTPAIARLVEKVALRYAGTFSDVVRNAVPPRHARAEQRVPPADGLVDDSRVRRGPEAGDVGSLVPADACDSWSAYRHGAALITRLRSGRVRGLHAIWSLAPARRWTVDVASAVVAAGSRGGGVIVIVPDGADVQRLQAALETLLPPRAEGTRADAPEAAPAGDDIAVLTADLGPQRRYQEFLRILRGSARIVIGTRAAVFAPVQALAAIIVWDDDDASLWDQHAPYWNARDVAAMRAAEQGCALIVGAAARSLVTEQWCASGWAQSLVATRAEVRRVGPRVVGVSQQLGDGPVGRLPGVAWSAAKRALAVGPILVQVARPGYLPRVACAECRQLATCACGGPLALPAAGAAPQCAWCADVALAWACTQCSSARLRAVGIGAQRTAAELGRAFTDVPVVWSQGGSIVDRVDDRPQIVVATGGVEPWADGGYACVLILDARPQVQRASLRAGEEAARRWFAAACLARPGAQVIVDADPGTWAVQALMRWDAAWLARRELVEREAAHLVPATRMAALRGAASDVGDLLGRLHVPHRSARIDDDRWIISVDRPDGIDIAKDIREAQIARAARRVGGPVQVMFDPREPLTAFARPRAGTGAP